MTRGIPLAEIVPGAQLRAVREDRVAALADSIRDLGLQTPVTVVAVEMLADDRVSLCTRYRLVAGNHRLAAVRRLGWASIPANIVEMDDLHRRLWAIDENLCRAELTELDCAEHLAQRKDIYEALHPETRHGAAPGKAGGGKVTKDEKFSSFAEDTAAKTGFTARSIQQAVRRADRIDAKVKGPPLGRISMEVDHGKQ